MLKLLPLGPQEVVLGEALFVEVHVHVGVLLLAVGEYGLALFVMLETLVDGPPPAVVLK